MLYVVRHAKSSWAEPWMADFDRPLNDRGEKDAPEMALRIQSKGIKPDLIISSPAKRAKTTALAFASQLGYAEKSILYKDNIYEADVETIFSIIRDIPSSYSHVFLFGHNPTFTYFVNELADVRIDNIPTCGVAAIVITGEWSEAGAESGSLVWFDYPKNR